MRAAFALMIFAACGLAPGPDPSGPNASSGNAPWTDLGPAQICLGDHAVGPPTAAPGGLCLDTNAPAATPCLDDSYCRSREACVCGRCTIAYCASASDCAAPRTCNFAQHRCDLPCSSSPQCGDVEECIAGVCRGRCATSDDCQHGEICDSNHVCTSDDCAGAGGCLGGERCEIQREPQQALEPSPIATANGGVTLYLDLAAPNLPDQRAIWRATSRDGVHFTLDPSHPVLESPESARAPSVVVDGGTLYLYFEHGDGLDLRVATSTNGTTFSAPTTVLVGPDVHAPAALHVSGRVVLYFERAGSIALATGAPQSRLDDQGPALRPSDVEVGDGTPGTAFWTPVTALASPHATLAGPAGAETIHLYFSALGTESAPAEQFGETVPIPPNFSIGFAAAPPDDPRTLAVWPYGPVADRVEAFLDHRDELGPGVVDRGDDRFLLYDVDADGDSLGRLGVLGSGRE